MRSLSVIVVLLALVALGGRPAQAEPSVSFLLDFTDYDEGSVEDWLEAKGFELKADADNRRRVDLDVATDGLVVEMKRRARALVISEADVFDFRKIRVTWQVNHYPEGANYDDGARNEALMVIVFFGLDKISSGSFLIPDSPYFIGLFLCKEGAVEVAYVGRYFQKGGRYVCLDQPATGEVVTSEYDLIEAFRSYFDDDDVPVVSGVAVQADTTDSGDGGKSRATITAVEFLQNE